jgi:AcrR family transcriptional regulator
VYTAGRKTRHANAEVDTRVRFSQEELGLSDKALRKDAASRRAAILLAAEEAFAEKGLDVPLDDICVAAGVGRATLYRNFENRTALVLALMTDNSNKLERLAETLGDRPDALRLYLAEVLNQLVKTGGLVYLIGTDPELDSTLSSRFYDHLQLLVARAQAAGRVWTRLQSAWSSR